jgi:hypothetical protein
MENFPCPAEPIFGLSMSAGSHVGLGLALCPPRPGLFQFEIVRAIAAAPCGRVVAPECRDGQRFRPVSREQLAGSEASPRRSLGRFDRPPIFYLLFSFFPFCDFCFDFPVEPPRPLSSVSRVAASARENCGVIRTRSGGARPALGSCGHVRRTRGQGRVRRARGTLVAMSPPHRASGRLCGDMGADVRVRQSLLRAFPSMAFFSFSDFLPRAAFVRAGTPFVPIGAGCTCQRSSRGRGRGQLSLGKFCGCDFARHSVALGAKWARQEHRPGAHLVRRTNQL